MATEYQRTVPYVWGENPQGQLGLGDNNNPMQTNKRGSTLKEKKEDPEVRQRRLRKRVDDPVAITKFSQMLMSEEASQVQIYHALNK